jgi:mRNA interferase YafQ
MRKPSFTRQFEKDLKRMEKRGKALRKIKEVMSLLIAEEQLAERYRDHTLIGNYKGRRECHIEPN